MLGKTHSGVLMRPNNKSRVPLIYIIDMARGVVLALRSHSFPIISVFSKSVIAYWDYSKYKPNIGNYTYQFFDK